MNTKKNSDRQFLHIAGRMFLHAKSKEISAEAAAAYVPRSALFTVLLWAVTIILLTVLSWEPHNRFVLVRIGTVTVILFLWAGWRSWKIFFSRKEKEVWEISDKWRKLRKHIRPTIPPPSATRGWSSEEVRTFLKKSAWAQEFDLS